MVAGAKQFPDIRVSERCESGDLQLEEMVLCGVEVYGVDSTRVFKGEGEDVVSSTGDSEDNIVRSYFQQPRVGTVVFPCEGVNVAIVEARVFQQSVVVVDPPVVILVPSRWERKTGLQVDNCGLVGFGVKFNI